MKAYLIVFLSIISLFQACKPDAVEKPAPAPPAPEQAPAPGQAAEVAQAPVPGPGWVLDTAQSQARLGAAADLVQNTVLLPVSVASLELQGEVPVSLTWTLGLVAPPEGEEGELGALLRSPEGLDAARIKSLTFTSQRIVAASSGPSGYQISGEVLCKELPRPLSLGLSLSREGELLRARVQGLFNPRRLGIESVEGAEALLERGLRLEVELVWRRAGG